MVLSKSRKKLLIILSIIVGILLILIFSVNYLLSVIIEGKINAAFEKNKSHYTLSIDDVGGNIFFGNIRLKGLKVKPDSSMIQRLKEGNLPSGIAVDADIPLLRITGVGLYNAIVHQQIDIGKIEIKRANIILMKGEISETPQSKPLPKDAKKGFDVDSIYMEGISGFSLGSIVLEKNVFTIHNVSKDEEVLKNEISHFEVTNFFIQKRDSLENVFRVDITNAVITLEKEVFSIPGGLYQLKLDKCVFTRADSNLVIKNLAFKPTIKDKYKMAKKYKFTQEIFDLHVKEINVYAISLSDLVRKNKLYIDSILVDGMDVAIFKDKRYPFDEEKRPKLPQESLKQMKMPMYIGAVKINNGKLKYEEKEEGVKALMTVKLSELAANIRFITSVRDSMRTGKPMDIRLSARMMEKPRLNVNILIPLNSRVDTFYFSGNLASADLKNFNSAAQPAIGGKFIGGKLNSLSFKAGANTTVSSGEMTMLYEGLEAELVKKDEKSKSKFMSWAANTVVKAGNPGKNGKTRVASLGFDRVMYKGLGNFIWKTLQSGIVNTVSPVGKHVKDEKDKQTKEDKQQVKETEKKEDKSADQEDDQTKKKKKERRKKKKK